ncbi:MAG: hypothetical protein ABIP71_12560 [Verrucomicrobiota bacterium]
MKPRFTIDGDDALEQHLAKTCDRVAADVRKIFPNGRLEALLLGGGYGRGQGGVLKTGCGDKPYNDLEFYICLEGNPFFNERKYRNPVNNLAHQLSPLAEVEIEFKITSREKLQAVPPTMFTYDLACGNRTLIGNENLFSDSRFRDSRQVPLFEATRLLMNRCSGLLFARERLLRKPFTADDADFVGRNHAKAQLGFGDAFLAAQKIYHWDCRERNHRLKTFSPEYKLPWMEELRKHHSAGVEFKLHPRRVNDSTIDLCETQRELSLLGLKVWLWLESLRLHKMFLSPSDYFTSSLDKCPETNSLHNVLVNFKTFRTSSLDGKWFRYPRERLLNSLALLLWEPTALTNPSLLKRLQTELRTDAVNFTELVQAYEELWRKFN